MGDRHKIANLLICLLLLGACGTPIHRGANFGSIETIESAMADGQSVNERDKGGDTPLHHAAWKGHLDVAEFLIDNGADVHARSLAGQEPLHVAAAFGNVDIMKLLVRHGADINSQMNDGRTPLFRAAGSGSYFAVEYLLEIRADPNLANDDGVTPLSYLRTPWVEESMGFERANGTAELLEAVNAKIGRPATKEQKAKADCQFLTTENVEGEYFRGSYPSLNFDCL